MAEENEVTVEERRGSPVLLVALLTLVLGAVGGYFGSGLLGEDEPKAEEGAEANAEELPDGSRVVVQTATYELGEFSLNLKDPSTMRILQMEIILECETSSVEKIEQHRAQLRDAVLMFTSEYTVASLSGQEGKMNLKDEILMRINAILKPVRVERVYFTKFIIGK